MQAIRPFTTNLQCLAAQWRVLGLMAVVFVRQILRVERSDPRRAYEQAAMLELWAHAAFATLCQQMAMMDAAPAQSTAADTGARAHLRAIGTALLMLALFMQHVKQRLAVRCKIREPQRSTALPWPSGLMPFQLHQKPPAHYGHGNGYFDTS